MKTFGDLFDEYIDNIYEDIIKRDELPSWLTGGKSPSELMKENDPTMYRCGFADWLQEDNVRGIECEDCGRKIDTSYIVNECDSDTAVLCQVCAGTHFECETCFEIKSNDEESPEKGMCKECYTEQADAEEQEEEEQREADKT